jgi:hypothetical protein
MSAVTIDEIERAIKIVAYCIKRHNMPEALPVLKRFEAELERRLAEGDAMDYADKVLARYTKTINAVLRAPRLIAPQCSPPRHTATPRSASQLYQREPRGEIFRGSLRLLPSAT